jgi:Gram-negative bacterial TonB protein C-terminal
MPGITLNEVLMQNAPADDGDLRIQFSDPAARMIVREAPLYKGIWSSLATALSRGAAGTGKKALFLFRETAETDFRLSSRNFLATFVLHVAVAFLILHFVHFDVAAQNRVDDDDLADAKIYYIVPTPEKAKPMRKIAPKGPGSTPGRGDIAEKVPVKGNSVFHKTLKVVSNPPHPDNNHQTIIQPASPPDLIIKHDVKIPNIVLGEPLPQPKSPTIALSWKNPAPKPAAPKTPKDSALPQVDQRNDPLVLGKIVPEASLPVAPPSDPAPTPVQSAATVAAADAGGAKIQGASGGKDLIAFGTDPDARATTLALPPGNRYGSFSISPDGSGPGSAGGSPNGKPGAGSGGNGPGGNSSTGIGPGTNGGGGGATSSDAGPVSVAGTNGNGAREAELKAAIAETMIYPVLSPINLRKNSMVISSGYVGGGGLGVYKALVCAKIYTVFLNMPGGNWTLEYCPATSQTTDATATAAGHTSVVHLEQGVIPPDASQIFDFKRIAVDDDSARKMIILRGTIKEDGSVAEVKIYQGLEPQMDEAAKLAFSKWKFRPALRDGKNIAVEFLVGIPPVSGPAR